MTFFALPIRQKGANKAEREKNNELFLKKLTLPPSRKNKAHDEVEALQTKQRKTTNLGEPRNGRMRQADT